MSAAIIDYEELRDASYDAVAVAEKLKEYKERLDELVTKMPRKKSGNILIADSYLSKKILELEEDIKKFRAYSTNISVFIVDCKSIDLCVKNLVNSLTAELKKIHGIINDESINQYEYELAKNRSIGDVLDRLSDLDTESDTQSWLYEHRKELLKYHYEGKKEFLKEFLKGLFSMLSQIVKIFVLISTLSGGPIVIVASFAIIAISIANLGTDCYNNFLALKYDKDDPATARRRRRVNSFSNYLRSTFLFYDYNSNTHNIKYEYKYNSFLDNFSQGIDIAEAASNMILMFHDGSNLAKNSYKKLTGDTRELKDISLSEVFSRNTLNSVKDKFFQGINAIKDSKGYVLKEAIKNAPHKFIENLGKSYLNFTGKSGKQMMKNSIKSLNNLFSLGNNVGDIEENGFSRDILLKIGNESFLQKGLSLFEVETEKDGEITRKNILLYDVLKPLKYGGNSVSGFEKVLNKKSILNIDKLDFKTN